MFLLDTNICAYLMKNSFPTLAEKVFSVDPAELAISSVTLFELEYGAEKAGWGPSKKQDLYLFCSAFRIVPFTAEDAMTAGRIRAVLALEGKPIGAYDLEIAAQGVTRNWTVITHNISEFSRVPEIKVEDWTIG